MYLFFILFSVRCTCLCNSRFLRVLKNMWLFPRMAVNMLSECSFVFGDVVCRVISLHIVVVVTQMARNTFHSHLALTCECSGCSLFAEYALCVWLMSSRFPLVANYCQSFSRCDAGFLVDLSLETEIQSDTVMLCLHVNITVRLCCVPYNLPQFKISSRMHVHVFLTCLFFW